MKQILSCLLLAFFAISANAQTFTVTYNGNSVDSGDTVSVTASGQPENMGNGTTGWEVQFSPIMNNGSGRDINAQIVVSKENETESFVSSVCTEMCREGYESFPFTIAANSSYTTAYIDFIIPATATDGLFKVNIIETSSDESLFAFYIITKKPTADIATGDKGELKVYPNPTSGLVCIEHAGAESVTVYDMKGAQIHHVTTTAEASKTWIDLTEMNRGMYLVSVMQADGTNLVKKLVVK